MVRSPSVGAEVSLKTEFRLLLAPRSRPFSSCLLHPEPTDHRWRSTQENSQSPSQDQGDLRCVSRNGRRSSTQESYRQAVWALLEEYQSIPQTQWPLQGQPDTSTLGRGGCRPP